jgi:hypothetical protein
LQTGRNAVHLKADPIPVKDWARISLRFDGIDRRAIVQHRNFSGSDPDTTRR